MTAFYRLRQGVRALLAFSRPVDIEAARAALSPPLLALFMQMGRGEQQHSLNVLRAAQAQGDAPDDLRIAALLHDAGKTRYPLAVWQKTLAVLVKVFLPAAFARWSGGDPRRWFYRPFAVYTRHPAWSAELLREAGASERAVWLVANHAAPRQTWAAHPDAALLERLQAADDAN